MNLEACNSVVLVMADSNFANLCVDATSYVDKFKTRMVEHRGTPLNFLTVKGKYGIHNIDTSIPVLDLDDRTKTAFGQTLENNTMMFDELVVISILETDPYILAARDVVTNANKTATQYQYARKR